ncbi:response regulator [Sphingomonas sp. ID0503]|uniref:response regulator n=1 Tax=Sphingomonas sp. ID0503 TaxID=3399691 RepID=UPI003AFB525F
MLFGKAAPILKRVLIVEDEPLVAFDNEHFLTGEGHEVVATVDTEAEALRILHAQSGGDPIDLVLADVRLHAGSGIEVARAAGKTGVPVIFVTGECPIDARALAVGCLAKPYAQRDLADAIAAAGAKLKGKKVKRVPGGFRLF